MKRKNRKSLLLIVLLIGLGIALYYGFENEQIEEKIILKEKIPEENMTLLFFDPNFELNRDGIGLKIKRGDKIISSSATSFWESPVTWNLEEVHCKEDCEPFEVIYGVADVSVNKIKVVINGQEFLPKLIRNHSNKLIWFVTTDDIKTIDFIEGYSNNDEIVYAYPKN